MNRSSTHIKELWFVGLFALSSSQVFAQAPPSASEGLATRTGQEVSGSVGAYNYVEPGDQNISIHGPKFGGEYTGTIAVSRDQHWFASTNVRGSFGQTTYDGWCSPFLITPDGTSPNGYALDVGDASPCSESGDKDGYLEVRGFVGKDFIGRSWAFSPQTGLGFRHLSNGLADVAGYRTDNYLYLPLSLTARTALTPQNVLSFNVEYDHLFHGWQTTRDSELGGGFVPATDTAPAFTLEGFSDVSFEQHDGWALRASAKYQLTRQWSVEPTFIHWNVSASPVNFETATFTVNGVTAQEQLGAYEPLNTTNEFAVKLGFHW